MSHTHSPLFLEIPAGDANTVFAVLMKVLREYKVPFDKIVGICSDGASTMQGVHKGVCTQLAKFIRELRQVSIYDIIAADHSRTIDSFDKNRGCKFVVSFFSINLFLKVI